MEDKLYPRGHHHSHTGFSPWNAAPEPAAAEVGTHSDMRATGKVQNPPARARRAQGSRRHSRHVGEEGAQRLQGVVPEILELPAQLPPHLRVDFGNSERIRLISQEVAVIGGLQVNFQI